MRQPDTHRTRGRLNDINYAVMWLEVELVGFHLTGACATEVLVLAERLVALTRPDKGHLTDGAKTPPYEPIDVVS